MDDTPADSLYESAVAEMRLRRPDNSIFLRYYRKLLMLEARVRRMRLQRGIFTANLSRKITREP